MDKPITTKSWPQQRKENPDWFYGGFFGGVAVGIPIGVLLMRIFQ